MRLALHTGWKDLRRFARDPIGLVVWLGMPLVVAFSLLAVFGRSASRPQGILFVADQDNTFLSSVLARAYTQGQLGEMITVRPAKPEEGRERVRAGEGSALLIIPKGFSSAVLRNQTAKLELVTNPSQAILPGILQEVTEVLADGASYLQLLAGDDLRRFAESPERPSDGQIAAFSVRVTRWIERFDAYLNPPVIEVQTEDQPQNSGTDYAMTSRMFPSMVLLAVVFLTFGYSGDVWNEHLKGTLRRAAVSPAGMPHFLGGKVLAIGTILAAVGILAMLAARLAMSVPIGRGLLAGAWVVISGAAFYLLMLGLHTLAGSQRAAHVTANIAVMTLAMLGGCFFPFEMMPESLARIGRHTPNGWALLRLKEMLDGAATPASVATAFLAAAAAICVLFLFASARLRRRFLV